MKKKNNRSTNAVLEAVKKADACQWEIGDALVAGAGTATNAVLEAAMKADACQWEIGDALIAETGTRRNPKRYGDRPGDLTLEEWLALPDEEADRMECCPGHRIPLAAGPSNAPRRIQPACIAMQQKRNHHTRIERRLAEPTHIAAHDRLEIELLCGGAFQRVLQLHQRLGGKEGSAPHAACLETKGLRVALPHQPNDKPRDVVLGHEVPHIRRQKQRLIDIPGAKVLAHSPSLNQTRWDFEQRLLGQAPRR